MLDTIINAAKGELTKQLGSQFQLNPQQADKALSLTKDGMQAGLLKEVTSGNISGLVNLFNGKSPVAGNPIVNGIVTQLVGSFTSKLGLNPQMASTVANFVVPFIVSKISSQKPSGGFDSAKLTQILGGAAAGQLGNLVKDQGQGLLGKVGKMFGKA